MGIRWPEKMYGHDKWGHFIQGVRAGEVDTDSLMTLSDEALESLQGQKMSAYQIYKHEWMMQNGSQRYKHTLCVDLTNMSMNMLRGKKRQVLQKIFHIGSTYYPESMWKIYLVNSPLIFRAIWAIIKPWLHPVTLSKIQIIGSAKEAIKKMNEEGIPIEAIPDWMGELVRVDSPASLTCGQEGNTQGCPPTTTSPRSSRGEEDSACCNSSEPSLIFPFS
uniref:CRAL-TRIO domain-containing protein n=1 Tax=Guillardia theta TaxID=55529 RepID=A0A7S4UD49_GUITH|mmetsp:Transcript_6055/g.21389  ORF Transcript_6055/g.21389 Transcript_6055/m.21389 type:complete len:219 (+) Transcript_6055:453-1109(+)